MKRIHLTLLAFICIFSGYSNTLPAAGINAPTEEQEEVEFTEDYMIGLFKVLAVDCSFGLKAEAIEELFKAASEVSDQTMIAKLDHIGNLNYKIGKHISFSNEERKIFLYIIPHSSDIGVSHTIQKDNEERSSIDFFRCDYSSMMIHKIPTEETIEKFSLQDLMSKKTPLEYLKHVYLEYEFNTNGLVINVMCRESGNEMIEQFFSYVEYPMRYFKWNGERFRIVEVKADNTLRKSFAAYCKHDFNLPKREVEAFFSGKMIPLNKDKKTRFINVYFGENQLNFAPVISLMEDVDFVTDSWGYFHAKRGKDLCVLLSTMDNVPRLRLFEYDTKKETIHEVSDHERFLPPLAPSDFFNTEKLDADALNFLRRSTLNYMLFTDEDETLALLVTFQHPEEIHNDNNAALEKKLGQALEIYEIECHWDGERFIRKDPDLAQE